MRDTRKFTREYFEKFRTTPIKLIPFSPTQKRIAEKWVIHLREVLKGIPVTVAHRGSTLLEITGKGDIDIAVYTDMTTFRTVFNKIAHFFGDPKATDENFAAFYTLDRGYEVEISLMKGREAKVDQALTKTLVSNPKFIREYQEIKVRYCFSKREYLFQRSKFFKRILKGV
jgi:hypothetical protein